MRRRELVLFFAIAFSFFGLINYYIYSHGVSALAVHPTLLPWFESVFVFLALAFIVGRFLERVSINFISSGLIWFGSFWLAAVVYCFLIVVAIDVLRLFNAVFSFIPDVFFAPESLYNLLVVIVIGVAGFVFGGAINAMTPGIKTLELTIPKKAGELKSLNIVAVSDIHLGTIICKARLERIVQKINSLKADIVLLPGDVVDEDIGPVIKQNLGETLRKIKSTYGVFAVTGNHEYIGGVEEACNYLGAHGVAMLRDDVQTVAESFVLVGREDLSYNRGRERRRQSLDMLMRGVDRRLPIILMDHQPFRLNEAEENGVDLQLSGHTHHGQMWPFSHITKRMYEVSWGYKKKGNTHIYVSCGVGSWGPPVRIGNTPEIMHITISFA